MILQTEEGIYSDVIVELISPKFDIAIISLPHLKYAPSYHQLANDNYIPRTSESLSVIGFPRMGVQQTIQTHLTTNYCINSKTVRNSNGFSLFNENIHILPINITSYVGMSGSPVLSDHGIIGIFSGSYSEGGAIGWVIPNKYIGYLQKIEKRPQEIQNWAPLTLMDESFKDLRRTLKLSPYASHLIHTYLDNVEALSQSYDRVIFLCTKLCSHGVLIKHLFSGKQKYIFLNSHFEPIMDTIQNEVLELGVVFKKQGSIHLRMERGYQDIRTWIEDESEINDSVKLILETKLELINEKYHDIAGQTIFSKTGANYKRSIKMTKAIANISNSKTNAQMLSATRRFGRLLVNCMCRLGSHSAIVFISRDISYHRTIGRTLFEAAQD